MSTPLQECWYRMAVLTSRCPITFITGLRLPVRTIVDSRQFSHYSVGAPEIRNSSQLTLRSLWPRGTLSPPRPVITRGVNFEFRRQNSSSPVRA